MYTLNSFISTPQFLANTPSYIIYIGDGNLIPRILENQLLHFCSTNWPLSTSRTRRQLVKQKWRSWFSELAITEGLINKKKRNGISQSISVPEQVTDELIDKN